MDGMSYGVNCSVTPGSPVTVSFYTRAANANAVGKQIRYEIYNYSGGSPTGYNHYFALGQVGVWERQTFTFTPANSVIISYWFAASSGVYAWDWSCMQVEQKSYATSFIAGTRGATVATGGGWADLIGNGNNGELVNGVRESSANGGSLVFDGVDDKVVVPYNSNLNPSNVTLSIWFKRTSAVYYSHFAGLPAFNSSWSFPYISYGIEFISTTDQPSFILGFSNNTFLYTTAPASTSTAVGVWVNVVGTYDGSFSKIYVNGQLATSIAETRTLLTTSANFVLGTETQGTSSYPFAGNIAQVSIYNRALTAAEVSQNFNANRSRYGL
jgi:hypothetical protein